MCFRGFSKIASKGSAGRDNWRAISFTCGSGPDLVSEKYTELGYTPWRRHPESIRSQIERGMFHWELEEPVLNFIYTSAISLCIYSKEKGNYTVTMLRPMAAPCQREKAVLFDFFLGGQSIKIYYA